MWMVRFWEELNAIQFLDWIFVLFRLVLLCLVLGAWMILGLGWKSERRSENERNLFWREDIRWRRRNE